jgi:hypothetical protein
MKRDWDVIREVLIEVEEYDIEDPPGLRFEIGEGQGFTSRAQHALLLHSAGFLEGVPYKTSSSEGLLNPQLTWQGHELLDTIRSKTVWEKVKAMAAEKGLELTFDAVKALGKAAIVAVVGGS